MTTSKRQIARRRAAFRALHPWLDQIDTAPMWRELDQVRAREGDEIYRKVVQEIARRQGELYDRTHGTAHFTNRKPTA
jgi:hypothetical protein